MFLTAFWLAGTAKAQKPSIEKLFQLDSLERLKNDRGFERSDLVSKSLMYQADEALRRGRTDEAIRLGMLALEISPASPAPHFFLSRAYWANNKTDISNILSQYLAGLRLVPQDFWFLFSTLETVILLVLIAFLLSLGSFIFYSAYAYGALWIHQISESTKGILHPVSAGFVFFAILLSPFLLGMPLLWFALFSFIIFWRFYQKSEKWTVALFLIIMGTSTWLIPFSLTFFTAKRADLLNEMVRNHQSDYFWLSPAFDQKNMDWKGLALLASYEAQEKNYNKAKELYEDALRTNPKSSMILNNIGNIFFYQKKYQDAINYYEQAVQSSPKLVSSYYNISQTYREMLSFDQGEKLFNEALHLDKNRVERFSQRTSKYPGFPVIDERFSETELWKMVLEEYKTESTEAEIIWRGWAGNIPIQYATLISIGSLITLSLSGFIFDRFASVRPCASCHKSICRRCLEKIFSYHVCKECGHHFRSVKKKSDFVIIEKAVKKIPRKFYPFFLLPGGGHLSIRKSGRGVLFMGLFFFLTTYLCLSDSFFPSTPWRLQGAKWIWVPLGLIGLYFISLFDLKRAWSKRLWP
ncbi:MAG: tetratricopeptide repeat protein [Nitrospiria bacterium]